MDDYINTPDSADLYDFDNVRRVADLLLLKAEYNDTNNDLVITLDTPAYMSKEQAEKLKPFLRSPLVYKWVNDKYSK